MKNINWTAVRAFRKPFANFMNEVSIAYECDKEMGHGYVSEHFWDDMQNHEAQFAEQIAKRFGLTGFELMDMHMIANEIQHECEMQYAYEKENEIEIESKVDRDSLAADGYAMLTGYF